MKIYRHRYESIDFLRDQTDQFVTWICPLLQPQFVYQDQYIFFEEDIIECVYFLKKGGAGFVLPFERNIVFIEINQGDDFGQHDIVSHSMETGETFQQVMNKQNL